ncbi:uncharacterized protein [Diabrotica undecimpunctata]|uniref:uncharacterized protein n=1 Tax=Diabrotica undecimpunctata TaxID=50387 RepID=UPI003B642342
MVRQFGEYFVSSIQQIVETIDSEELWSYDNQNLYPSIHEFRLLSLSDLAVMVKSLDNRSNNNEILNSKILKEVFVTCGHVILNFINTSLRSSKIPDLLKISTVVPIPKVNNTIKADEFRPINILLPIKKLLELVVYDQVMDHIDKNEILMNTQSGFRIKYSCETALQLSLFKFRSELDNNNDVVVVFLDLKRAFETIDRNILLTKLEGYGIGGNVLEWFKDYLLNRKQQVRIDDITSSAISVNIGVPQV